MLKRLTRFASLPGAGVDHHHALSSVNQNGHAAALAWVSMDVRAGSTESKAMDLAHAEIARA